MCSNVYTRFSPNVNDTIRKRDRNGDLIKDGLSEDGKQKYLMIFKFDSTDILVFRKTPERIIIFNCINCISTFDQHLV